MSIIDVIQGADKRVYVYVGKFSPYELTIGEIIKGLPDELTARMVLTDIMATLAELEKRDAPAMESVGEALDGGVEE